MDSQTTQRGTQRHNRRMAAGSNGVLRMDGTWVGEAVVASDTNEQRSPRSALALWLSSANLALSIFAKLGQGPRSSPRSVSVARSVNIKDIPSHSNARAVLSSAAPVVASQSTAPYSGAELCIYSHACPLPIAPSTAARLKSLPAVAITLCCTSLRIIRSGCT